ncbi:MAG: DNA adenine methylase [Cyanobacteria bacterium P01_C01_bin.89]
MKRSAVAQSSKSVRSPLRYPGGKSRAVKVILPRITELMGDRTTLVSPFIGGGSIELACATQGKTVYAYDTFQPLIAFWSALLRDPVALAQEVQKYYPLTQREDFYQLQKQHQDVANDYQAILFFVLNRASFSGTTLSGGCSDLSITKRFTQSSIDRLHAFPAEQIRQYLTVDVQDFEASLNQHPDAFAYLDPPYLISSSLYGNRGSTHQGFDHERLARVLRSRRGWILSYNDHPTIRDLYEGFEIQCPQWSYGMGNSKKSQEVLIISR